VFYKKGRRGGRRRRGGGEEGERENKKSEKKKGEKKDKNLLGGDYVVNEASFYEFRDSVVRVSRRNFIKICYGVRKRILFSILFCFVLFFVILFYFNFILFLILLFILFYFYLPNDLLERAPLSLKVQTPCGPL
jgi:hypothetical protein